MQVGEIGGLQHGRLGRMRRKWRPSGHRRGGFHAIRERFPYICRRLERRERLPVRLRDGRLRMRRQWLPGLRRLRRQGDETRLLPSGRPGSGQALANLSN